MTKTPLNVVIPLAGSGERFRAAGYTLPKPLVRAKGYPISCHCISSLEADSQDNVVLVYHRSLEAHNFADLIRKEFPHLNLKFVCLDRETRGAAETVLLGLRALSDEEMTRPTVVADGDSVYVDDVLTPMREKAANMIFCFEDPGKDPIYSYIQLSESSRVEDIREKVRISTNACIGVYGFESGALLSEYCAKTIDLGNQSRGEFYISNVYQTMLRDDRAVYGFKLKHWECLGTPIQLRVWSEQKRENDRTFRFCFDLDNSLVTYPKITADYTSCQPINRNIRFLRYLKDLGHHIIIFTARRMKTHQGNVADVVDDIGELTKQQLENFGVPYDELIFGKPYADFYVDDLAILPQLNMELQTGFYMDSTVETRPAHSLVWGEKSVTKTAPESRIANELFWYQNLPEGLTDIAPAVISHSEGKLEIERVFGVPLSQLYVNKSMTVADLDNLLATLSRLHAVRPDADVDIYANYANKIQQRFQEFDWSHLPQSQLVYSKLMKWAENYKTEEGGILGLIHGDPVFTNAILTPNHKIMLIDPRGEIGGQRSNAGDIHYDLAKVYQSLVGYDEILLDMPRLDHSELLTHFSRYVIDRFGKQALLNIRMITASLFFTLVPFHKQALHDEFLQVSMSLLDRHETGFSYTEDAS